jgi:hypothetical protein
MPFFFLIGIFVFKDCEDMSRTNGDEIKFRGALTFSPGENVLSLDRSRRIRHLLGLSLTAYDAAPCFWL